MLIRMEHLDQITIEYQQEFSVIFQYHEFLLQKQSHECILSIQIKGTILRQYDFTLCQILSQNMQIRDQSPHQDLKEVLKTESITNKVVHQDSYIEQFLTIFNCIDQQASNNLTLLKSDTNHNKQKPTELQNRVQDSRKTPNYNKTFHNFQKHLVTTIKSIFKDKTLPVCEDPEINECQKCLWKLFISSKKANKTILCLLVGDTRKFKQETLVQYGMNEILIKFGQQLLEDVQKMLRDYMVEEIKKAEIDKIVNGSRIVYKQEFKDYLQGFIELMKTKDCFKRMNGLTKQIKKKTY